MPRLRARLLVGALLALLATGTVGFARASLAAAGGMANVALPTSEAPALLGPIDALGRNGWQCAPERAAGTRSARDAELPDDVRR